VVTLMRHKILASTVALIITTMVIAAGPALGQNHGAGCDGHEGDHGRGCLPMIDDECEDGGWPPVDIFKSLFGNQDWCVYFTEQVSTDRDSY
jgi:hypothetical protein